MLYKSKKMTLQGSQVTIDYLHHNAPLNLIIFHGFGTNPVDFINWADTTYSQRYNLYALNMPGIRNYPGTTSEAKIEHYVNIYLEFLEKEKLSHLSFLAHSMGGALAAIVNAKMTQDLDSLILIAPSNPAATLTKEDAKRVFQPKDFQTFKEGLNLANHNASIMYNDEKKNQALQKVFEHALKTKYENPQYLAFLKELDQLKFLPKVEEGFQKAAKLYLIIGESDQLVDAQKTLAYFKKITPQSESFIVPKAGHRPWAENYDNYHYLVKKVLLSVFKNALESN